MTLVFWASALVLAYAWVGYPLLLGLVARRGRKARRPRRPATHPVVSVIVAAFNEAGCIADKLRSTLTQRYPWSRLEVVVVSDGSTDATDAIVGAWADPRVRLIRQEPRAGKSLALNRGVAAARGDVLVFTDANARFADDALGRLAAHFDDPRVGLVSGQGLYEAAGGGDARAVGNGYVRYEAFLRAAEGRLGFLAGADGAIYALRRSLYRELKGAEVNDLQHPIVAALAGFVCRFEPGAFTLEPPSSGGAQEFRRHVRIIAQGIHLTRHWLPRLLTARRHRAVWILLSHRALRWTSALFLAAVFVSNLSLLGGGAVYAAAFGGQLAFYALALAGWLGERTGRRLGRLSVPYYFCLVSAAGLAGVVRALRSGAEAVWAPAGRAEERAA